MHAMWMWTSLKENIKCGNNVGDVVRPTKLHTRKSSSFDHPTEVFMRQYNRYCELQTGDPSRNVIEKIFQASSSSKRFRKIEKVLRVNNSNDTLDRFEDCRETVKKKTLEQHKIRHPRSMVDGNELLRFYGTSMACCSGKKNEVSSICKDPTCRVCRLIQSGFRTSYNMLNGIRLNTGSDELSEDMAVVTMGRNVQRAAIICRTIAGGENYDSVGNGLNYLIIRNSSAVIPCFIVIFQ